MKLVQIEKDNDYEDYQLQTDNGEPIVSFSVEFNNKNSSALISYETVEKFRNQGYASLGLALLRDTLFQKNVLFLELINLTSGISRKVAENAGFISRGG